MSLVFAAITPHPPVLIEGVGKEQGEKAKQTREALAQLEQDLYIAKPNVVIVISPHTGYFDDAFSVNANTTFRSSFDKFGDMATSLEWSGTPSLAADISHKANHTELSVQLVSEEKIDHGASVPLHMLTSHLEGVKILPIGYSNLVPMQHIEFGTLLKDVIMESSKRIAVIASGDLSHCHETEAPGGFHKDGKAFDEEFMKLLETRNTAGMTQMDQAIVTNAQECAYRSTLILLGILKNMDYQFKNYSYEAPFGVGYLVGNFVI